VSLLALAVKATESTENTII